MKSSLEARRLIRAALKKHGGKQRAAARALRLPNNVHMMRILRGEIKDSPAMRAAVRRADERARKAWMNVPDDSILTFDPGCWVEAVMCLERALKSLKAMRRNGEETRSDGPVVE